MKARLISASVAAGGDGAAAERRCRRLGFWRCKRQGGFRLLEQPDADDFAVAVEPRAGDHEGVARETRLLGRARLHERRASHRHRSRRKGCQQPGLL